MTQTNHNNYMTIDDNDLDSIKKMHENTKKDLEKLNCETVFDFPHNMITLNTKTN